MNLNEHWKQVIKLQQELQVSKGDFSFCPHFHYDDPTWSVWRTGTPPGTSIQVVYDKEANEFYTPNSRAFTIGELEKIFAILEEEFL